MLERFFGKHPAEAESEAFSAEQRKLRIEEIRQQLRDLDEKRAGIVATRRGIEGMRGSGRMVNRKIGATGERQAELSAELEGLLKEESKENPEQSAEEQD